MAIVLVALALFAPGLAAQEPAPRQDGPTQIVLRIDGLACPICAYSVEKKLQALDATEKVEVDLEQGRVRLTLKAGAQVRDEVLVKTVRDAGFVVRGIERPKKPASDGASRSR